MLSSRTLAYGERAMTALLGLDRLYREESGDETGLAVLNLDTAGVFAPEPLRSYGEARDLFSNLRKAVTGLPEVDRREYYDQMCHSTLAFIRWREFGLSFESRLADFLHVPAAPASEYELDTQRTQLRTILTELGYAGDLSNQCAAWEEDQRVPPVDVARVLTDLMAEAWDRTEARLLEIPAPKSDGMRVEPVTGVPFNARCNYAARKVEINVDPVLTRPALKHLAVHEGYPGHYVQFKLRETLYEEGRAPADGLLSVVNTASSSVFEGIADAGMQMIDWIEGPNDQIQTLLNRYRAGIGTVAAWRLHALGTAEEEVSDWLGKNALTGGEGWVRNRMAFIAAPSRAVLIWSYWLGERSVMPVWDRVERTDRREFLEFLYGRMHSPTTVGMFRPGAWDRR
jgi:hypothetical protein